MENFLIQNSSKVIIAEICLVRSRKRRRQKVERVMVMMLLLKLKMSVRDRHFFRSGALFPSVKEAPWYFMYREGCYSNFNFYDSKQFRVLIIQIQKCLQIEVRFEQEGTTS